MRIDLDRPDLNRRFERLMREINPYAQKYKMLRDMTINGEEYVLDFVKYEFDDKRRYNRPTTSEMEIMIVSKDGSVPSVDIKVYPKQEGNHETTILKQISQHSDPMTFPILFPHGDFGWTYNMKTTKGKKYLLCSIMVIAWLYALMNLSIPC
ncbi:hypothetical protein JTE90_017629 [Oedothorax gibbosus]|uniref:Helitron helicase-like domain-containing protein n=1 Tax=Oedothorax gibbosus TaxID=931172 RepID=A0AAV6U5B1_9ARAC|nr:hypothetical protein JTE90_017629 [Oedothorax gibbosus]